MDILNKINDYIIKDSSDDFFQLYSFTNENISGYMPYFDLKGNSLLTVGSSCDQVFNASIAGCSDITVCDICPLTTYFYYLKLTSLLCLNRKEFLSFLCKTNYMENRKYNLHFLSKKVFNKIKSTLMKIDYESYYIWKYIFENYKRSSIEKLFRNDINDFESILYCNDYLKNDYAYNEARKKILNTLVDFICDDISLLKISKNFDNIWLSNVAQYLCSEKNVSMIENNKKILEYGGKMLLCYFWNTSMTVKGFHIVELFNDECSKIIIPGTQGQSDENSILVYEKK